MSSLRRLALPAAVSTVLTGGVVAVALATTGSPGPTSTAAADVSAVRTTSGATVASTPGATPDPASYLSDRRARVSRSAPRVVLHKIPDVRGHRFATAPLNLWTAPHAAGRPLAVLPAGGRVAVTGVTRGAFAQILRDGQVRWVSKAYLVDHLPKPTPTRAPSSGRPRPSAAPSPRTRTTTSHPSSRPTSHPRNVARSAAPTSGGISSAPCPDGSGTESGLTPSAVRLFRAVCNAFPALTTYGGYDPHGEHSDGKAIDFMVSNSGLGQAVADWARAHAGALDLYDVIWSQHIWTPVRSAEGWRAMPDRGSPTANHYDHVHIAVN